MRIRLLLTLAAVAGLSSCSDSSGPAEPAPFSAEEIRAAERTVVAALESNDPTAWVYLYTEDAVLLEPGSAPVEGRQALLEMARAMPPLSSVVISPIHTEGHGNLAYTYGSASWVNGRPPDTGDATKVRVVMIWRKEPDGVWRIAQEVFTPEKAAQ
jgi:uncharacterized protein (TIGR02246 family)